MKAAALILGLLLATAAHAACRTYIVTRPDGSVTVCTECCYGVTCTVTCS